MIKKVFQFSKNYRKQVIITPIYVAFEVVLECILPVIIAELVNKIQTGAPLNTIINYGLILILLAVVSYFAGWRAGANAAVASCGFAKELRKEVFKKVQNFSFTNIDKFSSSSLVTRLTTDIMNIQQSFQMIIRGGIRAPMMLIFSFSMAFYMGGSMAFIFLFTVPFLLIAIALIYGKVMPIFKNLFQKYDKLNQSIQENVKGIRVVKSFVREEFEIKKFKQASTVLKNDFTKAERILALSSPAMQFCLYVGQALIMFFGSKLIIESQGTVLKVGQLSGLLTYSFQLLISLMMISMIFGMVAMSMQSAKRVCEVLDEVPTIKDIENPIIDIQDGSISFENVSFKYHQTDEHFALKNINIDIKSGESIGIIGASGSSKTTLVSLISRLYDVTCGSVKVAGKDVKEYDLKALRDSVAVVLQKNLLFTGTIKENLLWGNENASDEEVIEACKLAQAHNFVSEFKDGYDTKISQGGTNVSGGQKQRLCIARALLKKPKILILDDSTSAVDTKTDALIQDGLRSFIPTTTKIIIAQRISSVIDADRIIVLDKGLIDDIGNHEELLSRNKIYQDVYHLQNKIGGDNNA